MPAATWAAYSPRLWPAATSQVVGEALGLSIRSIRRAWAGLRTFCPDRRPTVGADPDAPGFVWVVGQGGGGIKTAPAIASA